MSLSPSRIDEFKYRETLAPVRSMIRESFREDSGGRGLNGHQNGAVSNGLSAHHHHHHSVHLNSSNSIDHNSSSGSSSVRLVRRSPSVAKERTRDELIDSIVHTRTREHRVMPGFHDASDWEERKALGIDCDKVHMMITSKTWSFYYIGKYCYCSLRALAKPRTATASLKLQNALGLCFFFWMAFA